MGEKKFSSNNKFLRIITWVVALCGIAYFALPTIITSAYSVFIDDDFVHAAKVEDFHGQGMSYFRACVKFMTDKYMHWQGNFYSMFMQALLSPANQGGFRQLRITMVLNSSLFFIFLILLIFVVFDKVLGIKNRSVKLIAAMIFLYGIVAFDAFPEVYYWFSGITSYTIPITTFLIAMVLFLTSDPEGTGAGNKVLNWVKYIVALVLLVLVGGGTLAFAGLACWFLLVWNVALFVSRKKISIRHISLFAAAFLGTLITTLAPGNYERQAVSMGSEKSTLLDALVNTQEALVSNMTWMFHYRTLPLIMLAMFVIGIAFSKELAPKLKGLMVGSSLFLFDPIVVIFPVVYGYSANWVPNRCVFVLILGTVLGYGLFAMSLGAYVTNAALKGIDKNLVYFIMGVMMFIYLCVCDFGLNSNAFYTTWKNINDKVYQENYAEVRGIVEDLPNHAGEDVVLTVPDEMDTIPGFINFYLCGENEPEAGFNKDVARLYGLNSIARTSGE